MPTWTPLVLAALIVDLPLGPPAERAARELVRPFKLGEALGEGAMVLWGIRVEAREIRYEVGPPGGPGTATVRVVPAVDPTDSNGPVVRIEGPAATTPAGSACQRLAAAIGDNLAAGAVVFRAPTPSTTGPEESPIPGMAAARGPPDPTQAGGQPPWLAALLIFGLLAALLLSAPALAAAVPRVSPGTWAGAALIVAATAALLAWLPDVVAHHHGHGWDTARAVAGGANGSPFRIVNPYGPLALSWARLLGGLAAPGHEVFLASRVGATLAVALTFVLVLVLTERGPAALLAAGALAVQPSLLYMGRAEALTAAGLCLALTAATACALAARSQRVRLVAPAGLALAALASFQLLGPACAGPVGLLIFARPAHGCRAPRFVAVAALGGLLAMTLAAPHLLAMVRIIGADASQGSGADLPTTLLGVTAWTPAGLRWLAAAGGLLLLRHRPLAGLALTLWCLIGLYAPVGAAHTWASWPRYQLWALVPLAVGVGILGDAGAWPVRWRSPVWLPTLGLLSTGLVSGWLGLALAPAAGTLALDHPEDVQLRAWRAAIRELPAGAALVVPTTSAGQARASLPDVELLAERPDVSLWDLDGWLREGRPLPAFWFEPLYCHARYVDTPPDPSSQCAAVQSLDRREVRTWGAATELDPSYVDSGATLAWHLIPYPEAVVRIGLMRLR